MHASADGRPRQPVSKVNPGYLLASTWGETEEKVDHIETHAAHVFLCGRFAYKIKKPVKLPYLDFTDLQKRWEVIDHELAVNRVFTPEIYLGVIECLGEPVLKMRRFAQEHMLSHMMVEAGLDDALCEALARMVADSHERAAASNMTGDRIQERLGRQLSDAFTSNPTLFSPQKTAEFAGEYDALRHTLSPLLNVRSAKGLVRRCHGDMHCANIVVENGVPFLFDAIEFSEVIATVDVLYDLAFLLMDLMRFNRRREANRILNQYLHLRRSHEDLTGLAALPLFLSTRAGVRALVAADRTAGIEQPGKASAEAEAKMYFDLCRSHLNRPSPTLACIGGLSGTGKTTLARNIAHHLEPVPGAFHVRSDVERKVLAGRPEMERLPDQHYSASASIAVYTAVMERAEIALKAGRSVIIDAVFSRESERHAAEAMAKRFSARFIGLWLETGVEEMKRRVSLRQGDASDATADIIDLQLKQPAGTIAWSRVDTGGPPEELAAYVLAILKAASVPLYGLPQ